MSSTQREEGKGYKAGAERKSRGQLTLPRPCEPLGSSFCASTCRADQGRSLAPIATLSPQGCQGASGIVEIGRLQKKPKSSGTSPEGNRWMGGQSIGSMETPYVMEECPEWRYH